MNKGMQITATIHKLAFAAIRDKKLDAWRGPEMV